MKEYQFFYGVFNYNRVKYSLLYHIEPCNEPNRRVQSVIFNNKITFIAQKYFPENSFNET